MQGYALPADSTRKLCAQRVYTLHAERVCHVCRRAAHLRKLDQTEMLGIRTAWFEEVGGPPIGNKRASRARASASTRKQPQRLVFSPSLASIFVAMTFGSFPRRGESVTRCARPTCCLHVLSSGLPSVAVSC